MPIETAPIAAMRAALAEVGIGPGTATVAKIANLRREGLVPALPPSGPPPAQTVDHYRTAIRLTGQGRERTGIALTLAVAGFDVAEKLVRADILTVLGKGVREVPHLSGGPDETDFVEALDRRILRQIEDSSDSPLSTIRRHVVALPDAGEVPSPDEARDNFTREQVWSAMGGEAYQEEHSEVYCRSVGLSPSGAAAPHYATFAGMLSAAEQVPVPELLERTRALCYVVPGGSSDTLAHTLATIRQAFLLALALSTAPEELIERTLKAFSHL